MQYELSEVQVKNLFTILGNSVVKYNEASAISEILLSLQNPVSSTATPKQTPDSGVSVSPKKKE